MRVGGMKINLLPRRTSGPSWTLSCLERVPCLTSSASTWPTSRCGSSSCTRARGDKARRTLPGSCPWLGRGCGPRTSHPPRCYRLRAKCLKATTKQHYLAGKEDRLLSFQLSQRLSAALAFLLPAYQILRHQRQVEGALHPILSSGHSGLTWK